MMYVDANIILRYILGDNKELSLRAKEIIETSNIYDTTEVLAKVVYVLAGVYDVTREDVHFVFSFHFDERSQTTLPSN